MTTSKEGRKTRAFVYGAGGQLVATQNIDWNAPSAVRQTVNWEYWDAGGASRMVAAHGGGGLYYSGIYGQAELDPEGSNVGTANPNGTGGAGGGQPDLSQSPGGWGYGSFGDPFGAFGCRVDGFDYPQAMCIQHLANGTGDFVQHHDQPGFLGHWIDIDDPNLPPDTPDLIQGGHTITRFVSFPLVFERLECNAKNNCIQITGQGLSIAVGFVNDYLDQHLDCEKFINSLLSNLAKRNNIKLEGDVRFLLQEFVKFGAVYFTLPDNSGKTFGGNGSSYKGGDGDHDLRWKREGDGIAIKSAQNLIINGKDKSSETNFRTFLHEFIHFVGKRGDSQMFGDRDVVKSLQEMGLVGSDDEILEKYDWLRKNMARPENDPHYINSYYGLSTYIFSPYFDYKCGGPTEKPKFAIE